MSPQGHEYAHDRDRDFDSNSGDILNRWVKAILQVGLAGAGAFLIWFLTDRVDDTIRATHVELVDHTAITRTLMDTIQRQTEIQLQMCIMQARAARTSPDVCFSRSTQNR
jgi:hypothetical protein